MLREDTGRLWEILRVRPELQGFVLIGGSGLALQIGHRRSEDLDFAWPHGTLPRDQIDALIKALPSVSFVRDNDEIALQEAEDAGLDLLDYNQTFVADGIRLTFFASPPAEAKFLGGKPIDTLRVATVPEIFVLKALTSADRSKTRDWFDLYTLFKQHGFTWPDYHDVFMLHSHSYQYTNGAGRLCSGRPQSDDEGYENLMENPPTLEEMKKFFATLRSQFEGTQHADGAGVGDSKMDLPATKGSGIENARPEVPNVQKPAPLDEGGDKTRRQEKSQENI